MFDLFFLGMFRTTKLLFSLLLSVSNLDQEKNEQKWHFFLLVLPQALIIMSVKMHVLWNKKKCKFHFFPMI